MGTVNSDGCLGAESERLLNVIVGGRWPSRTPVTLQSSTIVIVARSSSRGAGFREQTNF